MYELPRKISWTGEMNNDRRGHSWPAAPTLSVGVLVDMASISFASVINGEQRSPDL